MTRMRGAEVRRRIASLDPEQDAFEIARLSLVTLNGAAPLVYALFTVAFLEQVAVPTMARTLYRKGTGDIVRETLKRNDDTITFFGQLLDAGPDSPVGRAWIERLNEIHARFPLRNEDSLYTLATLALDPHEITAQLGASPFSPAEREAQWRFWRAVAVRQRLVDIPGSREELHAWAATYRAREYASTEDGRMVARALVQAFGRRCLLRPLRPLAGRIIASLCPPTLRRVHGLPEPGAIVGAAVRLVLRAHIGTLDLRRLDPDRSLAVEFGTKRYGVRPPADVGHQRRLPDPVPPSRGAGGRTDATDASSRR